MATVADLLIDGFGRIRESVANAVEGLSHEQLKHRLDADANPVSWLIWHLTRVQDAQVAEAFGTPQVWTDGAWAARFGLPAGMTDHGYGHSRQQVEEIAEAASSAGLLVEYHEETCAQTVQLVSDLTDDDLDRVVDTRWTPPVTLGVRLISVLNDATQHVGQAAYVQGMLLRRG